MDGGVGGGGGVRSGGEWGDILRERRERGGVS